MFELREYKTADLPSELDVINGGIKLGHDVQTWNKRKLLYGNVQIYDKWHGRDYWVARVSNHTDIDYTTFRATLLENHTEYESQYIHKIMGYKSIPVPDDAAHWKSEVISYKFPFPLENRDMAIWLLGEEAKPGLFVVISLPRDLTVAAVKGLYVSVELVEQLEDSVRWTMAQTSNARGMLPLWVQRRAIMSAIAEDVPLYIEWLRKHKKDIVDHSSK